MPSVIQPTLTTQHRTESPVRTVDSSHTVLVVDDSQLYRDMVGKALREQGFVVTTASDGEAGLAELNQRAVSLIILDNEMPRMNGLDFLKAVRGDRRWSQLPIVMLTSTSSKDFIVDAMRYKIAAYILKERLSLPELVTRIQTILSAKTSVESETNNSTAIPNIQSVYKAGGGVPSATGMASHINAPNLVTRDVSLAAMTQSESVKTLAGVAKQLTLITESAKASAADLAAVVRQDPVLAARVIQLASSSAYAGTKSRLATVDDAVRIVGITAIRDIAASVGVFNAFPTGNGDGTDLFRCWQHAFAVAAVMTRIVPKTDSVATGVPHLVGLCHDLVEIILRQKFPAEFTAAADYATQAGVPTTSLLPAVFGASYEELTSTLLDRLKFPEQVVNAVKEFVRPRAAFSVETYNGLLPRCLAIANLMANGMLMTSSTESAVVPVTLVDCRSTLIPSSAINVAEIQSEAITTVCMLADLASEQAVAISKLIIHRRNGIVLYLRHPLLAPLDPIQTALKSIVKVESRETIPRAPELAGFDAIVVAGPGQHDSIFSSAIRQRSQMNKPIPLLMISATGEGFSQRLAISGIEMAGPQVTLRALYAFVSKLR